MNTETRELALKTDEAIADYYTQIEAVRADIAAARRVVESKYYGDETKAEHQSQIDANLIILAALIQNVDELNQIWIDNGRWTRTFIVPGGHVHSSMNCHTCFPTTAFYWVTDYSGVDEAEIVENAGDRACTICFPTAPVDRPTTMYTPAEKAAKADAAARADAKIAREAKRIAKAPTASGDPLVIPSMYGTRTQTVKTEATARQEWNRAEDYKDSNGFGADRLNLIQELIENALAAKHNVSPIAIREELQKRYAKSRR